MSLAAAVGKALDGIVASDPVLSAFGKLEGTGHDLRRYLREAAHFQCEIVFYRDKWWTREGGTLYGELNCLGEAVQLALAGRGQSLARLDYAVPLHQFQYGIGEPDAERSWEIRSELDVAAFEARMKRWLPAVALPWFGQLATMEGVVEFMARRGRLPDLALLHAARGEDAEARARVAAWVATLPRQIERPLDRLLGAGVLTATDHAFLARAALQSEDRYRDLVAGFVPGGHGPG